MQDTNSSQTTKTSDAPEVCPTEGKPDLTDQALYVNREISAVEFNRRVLSLAEDVSMPLLERLRFLSIVSANLDEFYEIRVAGVKQREVLDLSMRRQDQFTPKELLEDIREKVQSIVNAQYRLLNDTLLPELRNKGIYLLRRTEWTPAQQAWIKEYFESQVFPVLTPLGLDPAHPFPNIQNKALHFILSLKGKDAFGRDSNIAILPVPRCLPRIISFPKELHAFHEETGEISGQYVLLSSVIHAHIDELFPGMKVVGCYQFRVTRNADMWVDEEEVDDLLKALKGELHGRNFGAAVRLEVVNTCPPKLIQYLCEQHNLTEQEIFKVDGLVNLYRMGVWVNLINRPDLKFSPFSPGIPVKLADADIFAVLSKEDILLHHPYRSFDPVVNLVWKAAKDQDVLAIKMTLYRVGSNPSLIDALIEATRMGKDVTAVVELRARFDEKENINFAQRLIEAGVKVVYGVVNYKCHAKLLLVVRREGKKLRRYVHIGTGNYHIQNARSYTDYSLLTSDSEIAEDVQHIFMQLTGLGKMKELHHIIQAPFSLANQWMVWIDREIEKAKQGQPAWIMAKMNALSDYTIIQKLYEASNAGVQIKLIVRGICCLKPGIPGVSENIEVRSILGRFLEHHRVFAFSQSGVFIGSSDLMVRNLHRRVEVCCPILDGKLKNRLLYELQEIFWRDNECAWTMQPDGNYLSRRSTGDIFCAQKSLLQELSN